MYVYIVIIITLIAAGFFIFVFSSAIQVVQEAFNPNLGVSQWMDQTHFDTFKLAATFVTQIWVLFPILLIMGLAYWSWVYTQRKSGGY